MFYLERVQSDGKVRKGLIGKIDLEEYDYNKGSTSMVRATEGTVLERIPPRQAVRRDALIELPHVMLLIDDPQNAVIGPLNKCTEVLYDFDMMQGGGHAKAWLLTDEMKAAALEELQKLADTQPLLVVCQRRRRADGKCDDRLQRKVPPEARTRTVAGASSVFFFG